MFYIILLKIWNFYTKYILGKLLEIEKNKSVSVIYESPWPVSQASNNNVSEAHGIGEKHSTLGQNIKYANHRGTKVPSLLVIAFYGNAISSDRPVKTGPSEETEKPRRRRRRQTAYDEILRV